MVISVDYDGASTSEARDETGNIEQQDMDDGGDGVSSEGEKPLSTEANEVKFDKEISKL